MAKKNWGSGAMTAPQAKTSEPADFPTVSAADAQREVEMSNGNGNPTRNDGTQTIAETLANGAPKEAVSATRKPRDPNAPRNKYVVHGIDKVSGATTVLYVARSMRDAHRWIGSVRMMLHLCCREISIVRSKTVHSEMV